MSWIFLLLACLFINDSISEEKRLNQNLATIFDEPEEIAQDTATPIHGQASKPKLFTIDERIVNAAHSSKVFELLEDGKVKLEYDMVFYKKHWDEFNRRSRVKRAMPVKRTNGILNFRWTNNHIPYEFVEEDFTPNEREIVVDAMKVWESYTCLTFSPATTGNRVLFKDGVGCDSHVGMVGGAQTLDLAIGCRDIEPATHEIGHAIGLIHEQTRPDRDDFVKIITENIPTSQMYNFDVTSREALADLGIPYDYLSIMHYGGKAFSATGGYTIETLDKDYQSLIGTATKPSFRDIKTVNLMYKCGHAEKGCALTDADCPGEGFVGKDCMCWCQGEPYLHCPPIVNSQKSHNDKGKASGVGNPNTGEIVCTDRHAKCSHWAAIQECTKNPNYMLVYCKKSCKICGGGGGGSVSKSGCADKHKNCPLWAGRQECTKNPKYMLMKCKKSCKKCGTGSTIKKAPVQKPKCVDKSLNCKRWSRTGECQRNPAYMLKSCRKSCAVC